MMEVSFQISVVIDNVNRNYMMMAYISLHPKLFYICHLCIHICVKIYIPKFIPLGQNNKVIAYDPP